MTGRNSRTAIEPSFCLKAALHTRAEMFRPSQGNFALPKVVTPRSEESPLDQGFFFFHRLLFPLFRNNDTLRKKFARERVGWLRVGRYRESGCTQISWTNFDLRVQILLLWSLENIVCHLIRGFTLFVAWIIYAFAGVRRTQAPFSSFQWSVSLHLEVTSLLTFTHSKRCDWTHTKRYGMLLTMPAMRVNASPADSGMKRDDRRVVDNMPPLRGPRLRGICDFVDGTRTLFRAISAGWEVFGNCHDTSAIKELLSDAIPSSGRFEALTSLMKLVTLVVNE